MATLLYNETEEFHTEDIMSLNHSRIAYNLTKALFPYDGQYDILPELEFELPDGNVKPDISVCERQLINWKDDIIRLSKPPIIAIEILSPRQAFTDLTDKAFKIYLPSGVKSVWIIIPAIEMINVLELNKPVKTFTEGFLIDESTGIKIDVSQIFN
jgi:Uma2 family endonuclease